MPGNCDTRRSAMYWMHRYQVRNKAGASVVKFAGFWRAREQSWSSAQTEQQLLVLLLAHSPSQDSDKEFAWQVCGDTRQFFTCSN